MILKRAGSVIIPEGMKPYPESHEKELAAILVRHFSADVEFLLPIGGYKTKTPDAVIMGVLWEFKSPIGNSKKSTIQAQFNGLKQSRNLVIDGRRTKLDDALIQRQIQREIAEHKRVGRILFVTKSAEIIEF